MFLWSYEASDGTRSSFMFSFLLFLRFLTVLDTPVTSTPPSEKIFFWRARIQTTPENEVSDMYFEFLRFWWRSDNSSRPKSQGQKKVPRNCRISGPPKIWQRHVSRYLSWVATDTRFLEVESKSRYFVKWTEVRLYSCDLAQIWTPPPDGTIFHWINSDRDLDHPVFVGDSGSCSVSAQVHIRTSLDLLSRALLGPHVLEIFECLHFDGRRTGNDG